MTSEQQIVGRYAPSPTGDLHHGNLRTALIAWLHARLQGGEFLLRMEDLDTPRTVAGSADRILEDLAWLGLDWDGEVVYQSERQALYQLALEDLQAQLLVYPCFCSRRDIQQAASAPHINSGAYPGTCLKLSKQEIRQRLQDKQPALRIKVGTAEIVFNDACLGSQQQNLAQDVGDFVIKRADGLFAYQLAVVVDDLQQGITDVVRGADLADSTARQIYLCQKLKVRRPLPNYCHVPLMLDQNGQRLAKRDGSQSVRRWRASGASAEALVGELAAGLGLCSAGTVISLADLRQSLDFESLLRALQTSSHE